MTDFAASHCRVCAAETNRADLDGRRVDAPGFDRDLAMEASLRASLQASSQNSLQSSLLSPLQSPLQHPFRPASQNLPANGSSGAPAAAGAGNNLMSVAEPGLPHADPGLRNVFMQAVQNNRDRMAAELSPVHDGGQTLQAEAQPGLAHANPGLRDVFMQAVQNNRDRMAGEVASAVAPPMPEAGAHPAHAGLEALHHATRDVMQDAIDRQAEALPVRDMMRDGLLGVIHDIENPSPIAQMQRSHALGPDSRLDIDRVDARMVDHLRDAIALFDRMQEAGSDDEA